ncbi:M56 family metallopeptidase [Pontibacter sp. JH31]|uniref:M56 family metallopeptidase n=1 Tax=Pontibacter aquaedesilientis TaxID=2766980 RepID=A0ABR7XHS6_9BACT|nr:M56 family metallopeptidase [Pontibacter aquaedesilientis]MBD1396986.1 M56 family metallopeptidase [Pontibacter aquaedesilientis]
METTVNYLLQSGLGLLMLYLFYVLLLRKQPSLRYNRLFLLLAPAVALAAPLIRLPLPLADALPVAAAIPTFQLPEVAVIGHSESGPGATDSLPLAVVLIGLYTLVSLIMWGRLAWQLLQIQRLAAVSVPLEDNGTEASVLQTEGHSPTFAFLHYVFLSRQPHLTEKEQHQILAHELAHVRLRHTYDILYYEVLTALLWFNPLVWLLKEELRDVHEYQADAEVLSDFQANEYSSLLAKEVLYTTGIPVGSYFQKPQVFRRLHMLQQHGRQGSMMRSLLVLPLLLVLLVAFSNNRVRADIATTLAKPASLNEAMENVPAHKAAAIPSIDSESKSTAGTRTAPSIPEKSTPVSNPEREIENSESGEAVVSPNEKARPYTYVEQMPEFKGGEVEMLKFLGTNIKYPKTAQEAGMEGLVVVSFVVDTDGSLYDIAVLKKLHDDLDREAVRVVETMNGQWIAGKQNGKAVPVRYTLPIRFAIK